MSLGAETKASGPPAAGMSNGSQSPDLGNQAGLLLSRLTVLPAIVITGWLIVGLPLLLAGVFTPVLMLVLSIPVIGGAELPGLARPRGLAVPGRRRNSLAVGSAPWWSVIAVIAIAVAFGVDQMIFHSEFVIITRDPASYIQFGQWLAGTRLAADPAGQRRVRLQPRRVVPERRLLPGGPDRRAAVHGGPADGPGRRLLDPRRDSGRGDGADPGRVRAAHVRRARGPAGRAALGAPGHPGAGARAAADVHQQIDLQ